jgi:hypothetical protein
MRPPGGSTSPLSSPVDSEAEAQPALGAVERAFAPSVLNRSLQHPPRPRRVLTFQYFLKV